MLFKKCYDDLTKRTWTVQCNVQFTVRLSVKGAEQSPQRLTLALLHEKNVTMSRMVLVLFRERYQAAQQQHRTEDIC